MLAEDKRDFLAQLPLIGVDEMSIFPEPEYVCRGTTYNSTENSRTKVLGTATSGVLNSFGVQRWPTAREVSVLLASIADVSA